MKQRVTTGGKASKAQRRNTTNLKRRAAAAVARSSRSSDADLREQLDQSRRELKEALEQQAATSEVLKVISSSPGDLKPVFDAMLDNAMRICGAELGQLNLCAGDAFRRVAARDVGPAIEGSAVFRPDEDAPIARAAALQQVVHVEDYRTEPAYLRGSPSAVRIVEIRGARTLLAVPMVQGRQTLGVFLLYRREVRLFEEKHIELVKNFAAQAVIAIENTRLLNELRQRTDDLTEALEQQTATSEVLRVISSSPGELEPVFNAMLENAVRICQAEFGNLLLGEGDTFRHVALHGAPAEYEEGRRTQPSIKLGPRTPVGRCTATGQVVQIADFSKDELYRERDPSVVFIVEKAGARTVLAVPMLKEGKAIGAILIYRQEVRPFTNKQIELVENFAAQAVIAIENTRLLNELRQRTDDLSESLERQTATSEVLKVISSSPGELQPVFESLLDNATRICDAKAGNIYRWDGTGLQLVASHNAPAAFVEFLRRTPLHATAQNPVGRMLNTKSLFHTSDLAAQSPYVQRIDPAIIAAVELGGVRTQLSVPLLKENEFIGAITLWREEVRPFSDKQIELVENFAAQAVIAIENTRLLNELRESLAQQTATAEVLRIISSSPGELEPVFQAMLESAVRICDAKFGNIYRWDDESLHLVASRNTPSKFAEFRKNAPFRPGVNTPTGRMVATKAVTHVADLAAEPGYAERDPQFVAGVELGGIHTLLSVPMLKDDELIGAFSIYRDEVRPFADKQIELVQNFAAQAVIAIENARLLSELRRRTEDLTASLEDLQTAQDRLVQTQKLASLGQLTAGIAHEIKNPLNFVNNFSSLSTELLDELQETLQRVQSDEKTRDEINDLTDTLRANLDKIEQHGKRADSIVKNMLLHSREGSGEHRPIDINAVVEESLNLAYHGARAEKQDFNITLERSFDPAAGEVDVFPQEITRVLLNLIANGFYAATKRKAHAGNDAYEPALTASTRSLGDRVEIRVRDNGTGIPPEVKDKMFNPFFTTKPPGEGTGLGLSLSHDIIVKQHAGLIEVDTEPGQFTEFRIILPRNAASFAKTRGRS